MNGAFSPSKSARRGALARSAAGKKSFSGTRPKVGAFTKDMPQEVASDGRSDDRPVKLAPGTFIVPADVVSAMGRGSSEAGHQALAKKFPLPEDPQAGHAGPVKPLPKFADGGAFSPDPADLYLAGLPETPDEGRARAQATYDNTLRTLEARRPMPGVDDLLATRTPDWSLSRFAQHALGAARAIPDAFVEAVRTPLAAYTGEMPIWGPDGHVTDDAIQSAHGMAGLVGSGAFSRAAMSAPVRDGVEIGIFGGRRAAGADLQGMARSNVMRQKGADPAEIWAETGWGRGAEGKPRFEIDDSAAAMIGAPRPLGQGRATLEEVLQHPELYERYPHLRRMPVLEEIEAGRAGSYSPTSRDLSLDPRLPGNEQLHTILHEVQHAVSDLEGFAPGASMDDAAAALRGGKVQARPGETVDDPFGAYLRSAGEVEARNVEARQAMTAGERRAVPPQATEDVPRADQWLDNGRPAVAYADGGQVHSGNDAASVVPHYSDGGQQGARMNSASLPSVTSPSSGLRPRVGAFAGVKGASASKGAGRMPHFADGGAMPGLRESANIEDRRGQPLPRRGIMDDLTSWYHRVFRNKALVPYEDNPNPQDPRYQSSGSGIFQAPNFAPGAPMADGEYERGVNASILAERMSHARSGLREIAPPTVGADGRTIQGRWKDDGDAHMKPWDPGWNPYEGDPSLEAAFPAPEGYVRPRPLDTDEWFRGEGDGRGGRTARYDPLTGKVVTGADAANAYAAADAERTGGSYMRPLVPHFADGGAMPGGVPGQGPSAPPQQARPMGPAGAAAPPTRAPTGAFGAGAPGAGAPQMAGVGQGTPNFGAAPSPQGQAPMPSAAGAFGGAPAQPQFQQGPQAGAPTGAFGMMARMQPGLAPAMQAGMQAAQPMQPNAVVSQDENAIGPNNVAALGNGNLQAGGQKLQAMIDQIRSGYGGNQG